MKSLSAGLRTIALESTVGRSLFAAGMLVNASRAREPHARARALLRGWRAVDNPIVASRASRYLQEQLTRGGHAIELQDNPLLQSFARSPEAAAIRREFSSFDISDRVRLRFPRPDEASTRLGDLMVLKTPDDRSGEKGVLLIKYTEAFDRFAALFQVDRLVTRYMVVLEPSWWGYQDATYFLFAGRDADVVVQAPALADFRFLDRHGHGLVPVRLGAGDWIDPTLFTPSDRERRFDVVMVSSWNPFKRHHDLISAIRVAKEKHGRIITAALIGYPNGWTADYIRKEVERQGIADQVEVFDRIPQRQVAEIVSTAKLYVLLSRREGANKAMYEAMFCDTPVLAPRDHKGINQEHINDETGLSFDRGELMEALLASLERSTQFSPRQWALAHTGYELATHRLNDALASLASRRGGSWTVPIVAKKNQPNLCYASDSDRRRFDAEYKRLAEYLRSEVADSAATLHAV
jgi:hypothetical protein